MTAHKKKQQGPLLCNRYKQDVSKINELPTISLATAFPGVFQASMAHHCARRTS